MDLTDVTGSFGRWQIQTFIVFFYVNVVGIWQNLAITFLAPNVPYRCVNSSADYANTCTLADNITACTHFEYDIPDTIVSEWNLVCDREWLVSLAKSIYMVGFLVSVLVFGQVSDWFGRFPAIIVSFFVTSVSMFLSLFSTSYTMFVILRFFQAFGRTGLTTVGFVLVMEMVGNKHRTEAGIGIQFGWALGFVSLAGLAYFVRHWWWLQVGMTISLVPLLFTYSLVSESPRWLLMQGKTDKLEKLLKKGAQMNGKEFKLDVHSLQQEVKENKSILELFRTPRMRIRIIYLMYIWVVNAFLYYGLSFNTNDLAGDMYVNFLTAGLLEFPSYLMLYWGIRRWGRRLTLAVLMLATAVAQGLILPIPQNLSWLSTALAMFGKFCVTGSFGLLYLYTGELSPTVVRNTALGTCSMCARFGSIVAPFSRELGRATHPLIPNMAYCVLALTSGLLTFLLPETKGQALPDSLEDGEQFGRSTVVEDGTKTCKKK